MFHSEAEFVHWLQRLVPEAHRSVRVSIGDDAGVVRAPAGRDIVATADLSIDGVHFSRRIHPARSVGHRALARSLSDIAAMGAEPRFALISLAISRRLSQRWVEEFYRGLASLAKRYGVSVIGGDTSLVAGGAAADVAMLGEVATGRALLRSGAHPGDLIFVSGRLGQAELGLRLLRSRSLRREVKPQVRAAAIRAHLYPEPRCALGKFLGGKRLASAAMDLSDGLSLDLWRLCRASGVGARLAEGQVPCPEIIPIKEARRLALNGGEDYELLFTVSPANVGRLPRAFRGVALYRIGEITRSKQVLLIRPDGREAPLEPLGSDHFRDN